MSYKDREIEEKYLSDDRLKVDLLDLTAITRSSKMETCISVKPNRYISPQTWIKCGVITLTQPVHRVGRYDIRCILKSATDFEHDHAHAFRMGIIGLTFDFMDNGSSYFNAYIDPESPLDFHVPNPGYDPFVGAVKCRDKHCSNNPHVIVDEGFYIPPINEELWLKFRGCNIDIVTYQTLKK